MPNSDLDLLAPPPQNGHHDTMPVQLTLEEARTESNSLNPQHTSLDASMDHIRKRFGFGAISFGTSLSMRDNDDGWREIEKK